MKYKVQKVNADDSSPLSQYVEDEYEIFIIDTQTGLFYTAKDFFYSVGLNEFFVLNKHELTS